MAIERVSLKSVLLTLPAPCLLVHLLPITFYAMHNIETTSKVLFPSLNIVIIHPNKKIVCYYSDSAHQDVNVVSGNCIMTMISNYLLCAGNVHD